MQKGTNVLIHAAAGGVGLIACQWANHLGANVIGTVGSKEKAELAKANGCHHTILYRDEDFVARVKEITGGKLCEVVYDGVGKATFPASLDCIKPLGMFVSFGSASGPIEAFNINLLQTKGSLFATRPTLNTYAAKREDLLDDRQRPVRGGGERRGEDSGQPEIRAQGRAEGAPRSRRPRHHRLDHPAAVIRASDRHAATAIPFARARELHRDRGRASDQRGDAREGRMLACAGGRRGMPTTSIESANCCTVATVSVERRRAACAFADHDRRRRRDCAAPAPRARSRCG